MHKSKKTFIDRKNAVTFHLVHRSQHDPLVADETAPQHVLVESATHKQLQREQQAAKEDEVDKTKRKEEQLKYGIRFDDDYNYLQHLKKPEQEVVWEYVENPNQARKRIDKGCLTTAPKLNLPSSVFASEFEEDEGLLNKAVVQPGPHPEWDPDVVAALDDDFNFDAEENQLEDDFMQKAMGNEEDEDGDDDIDDNSEEEEDIGSDFNDFDSEDGSEMMDRLAPLMRDRRFGDDNRSQFTEYSMSSSVIRRNEQLTLLDDRFEQFYATYDDPELGDLSMENIEGGWHQKHPYVMDCLLKSKKSDEILQYEKKWDKERIKKYGEIPENNEPDPNEEMIDYEVGDEKEKKWDCESILSTYSNIYNHPKVIDEPHGRRRSRISEDGSNTTANIPKIEIDPKTGLPMNVLRGNNNGLTAKALANLDNTGMGLTAGPKSLCEKSVRSTLSILSIRPKDETPEEKKDRKRLIKDYRNERRIEKKANTFAFKEEKKRQTHVKINQHLNQTGTKIV